MLGQAASLKIGNQKLVSLDSIALFGIVGLLAAIGAIMTHNFQTDEQNYIDNFTGRNNIPLIATFNETCIKFPAVVCDDGYSYSLTVDCESEPKDAMCPDEPPAENEENPLEVVFEFETQQELNDSLREVVWDQVGCSVSALNVLSCPPDAQNTSFLVSGWVNNDDSNDFRLFAPPQCTEWCTENTTWMYRLCIAVAALCVGFSGLVFLYLYLGCILDRINPRRRLERLANLLLMRGEEPPKLDRINTASKSESIRPDLKEY